MWGHLGGVPALWGPRWGHLGAAPQHRGVPQGRPPTPLPFSLAGCCGQRREAARRPPGGRPGAGGAVPAPGPPWDPPGPPVPVPGLFGAGRKGGCRAPAVYRLYLRVN